MEEASEDVGLIPGLGRSPGGRNGNPPPVFLPGESHGLRSLEGCTTECLSTQTERVKVAEHAEA